LILREKTRFFATTQELLCVEERGCRHSSKIPTPSYTFSTRTKNLRRFPRAEHQGLSRMCLYGYC